MVASVALKAPFPWFGGKATIASLVWERFGPVANYVEPFFGSGAVLLGNPAPPVSETVNDADALLCNFWRALQADPEAVAYHADYPVSEVDLHARHLWLLDRKRDVARMIADPEWFDAKTAGWWVWGTCAWIGSGWCSGRGPWHLVGGELVNTSETSKLPHLGDAGQGINRQLPHLGDAGRGIADYLATLADRLRRVRITCGDWSRVVGPSVTTRHGLTAVFLDPPYSHDERQADLYSHDHNIGADVRDWAIEQGSDPLLRIALCGYEGEHTMPEGWEVVRWKARGGFGSQGDSRGRQNATRECVWFSPTCLGRRITQSLLPGVTP